jgi:hypothetical protein
MHLDELRGFGLLYAKLYIILICLVSWTLLEALYFEKKTYFMYVYIKTRERAIKINCKMEIKVRILLVPYFKASHYDQNKYECNFESNYYEAPECVGLIR